MVKPAATVAMDVSTQQTVERTRLAYERTLMAWVRTGVSLISFGFTIYKFFQEFHKSEGMAATGLLARISHQSSRQKAALRGIKVVPTNSYAQGEERPYANTVYTRTDGISATGTPRSDRAI